MNILPPETALPLGPLARTHRPPRGPYKHFRACLAWEFGFQCAFCLAHDSDLNTHGFTGMGLMWIEHHRPQSRHPGDRDKYDNCFYSCLFCNQHRRALPLRSRNGALLLQPCKDSWHDQFVLANDEFRPSNPNAEYTLLAYDLNDPRKITMRRTRREVVTLSLDVYRTASTECLSLMERLAHSSLEERIAIADKLVRYRDIQHLARRQLEQFRVIPPAWEGKPCACATRPELAERFTAHTVAFS